jgi:phosphopentomutase
MITYFRTLNFLICFFSITLWGQNVIVVVLDGARYSETFGADSLYIPNIWNQLRPLGTIWTNVYNEGLTRTGPAHASIASGVWQTIDNKGNGWSKHPTIFEYFRKYTNSSEQAAMVVVGKRKLDILTYSTHPDYGIKYKASYLIRSGDTSVINTVKEVLTTNHPRLLMINMPSVDPAGHSGDWAEYIAALHIADSLIWNLWQTLQSDSIYRNNTTLFITNDHGRHDDAHEGFEDHGDDCNGCRHVMLLAAGRGFTTNKVVKKKRTICDVAPTIGKLLSFPTKYAIGTSLLNDIVVSAR